MRIVLRGINMQDGKVIMKWRNDTRNFLNCIDRTIITEESFANYFETNIKTENILQYMAERYDPEMPYYGYSIGSLFLRNIDRKNKRCELGILPSTDFEWNEEGKITALKMAVEKCFSEMGFHKIYAYVFADVAEEISLFYNAGFSEEGTLKDEFLMEDGTYRDLMRMVIFNRH